MGYALHDELAAMRKPSFTPPPCRYIGATECAKLIRAALKRHFPRVKFTVRTSKYSGGSSIRIGWTDGPTEVRVNAVVGPFEGAKFDGMIDMAYSRDTYLLPSGDAAYGPTRGTVGSAGVYPAENPPMPAGAELVRFSSMIFTSREHSGRMLHRAARWCAAEYGVPVRIGTDGYGREVVTNGAEPAIGNPSGGRGDWYWSVGEVMRRAMAERNGPL